MNLSKTEIDLMLMNPECIAGLIRMLQAAEAEIDSYASSVDATTKIRARITELKAYGKQIIQKDTSIWDDDILMLFGVDGYVAPIEYKPTPVCTPDGKIENFVLKIKGTAFRCTCGCNVFHKPDLTRLERYKCNACDFEFECE